MDLRSCLRETGAFFWLITNTQRAKELASDMEGSIGGCQWDTGPPHFALDPNSALVWTLGWKKMACQRFTKSKLYNLPPRKKTKILQQLRCKGLCNRISNIWTSFPKKNRKNEDFHNTFAGENRTFGPAGPSSLRTVQTKTVTNGCRKRCCGVFQQGRLGATKVLIIFHKGHVRKEDH